MTAVLVSASRAEEIDLGDDLDLSDVVLAVRDGLESDAGDAGEALTRLRSLVVAPLRLEASVRTVFLGANGALASVPGAALFPDRAVAVLPCLSVLRMRPTAPPARGNPVLAVGSPAFRTDVGRMKPLPGATREARELDTSPLLGPAATRSALRERLASAPRWRALHLAGLIESDAERPLLTSFGLATTEEDDGHWMAREVAQERIPADLVVLSACLACGTSSVPDAGVAALPCAFLTAGVPSVVGFVGRLDDEAGVAFAVALYAALRKGATTGDAVRVARDAVRSQARWAHPRYWLGWTLWGLPD
jgi:CHAT domain-containing protein